MATDQNRYILPVVVRLLGRTVEIEDVACYSTYRPMGVDG